MYLLSCTLGLQHDEEGGRRCIADILDAGRRKRPAGPRCDARQRGHAHQGQRGSQARDVSLKSAYGSGCLEDLGEAGDTAWCTIADIRTGGVAAWVHASSSTGGRKRVSARPGTGTAASLDRRPRNAAYWGACRQWHDLLLKPADAGRNHRRNRPGSGRSAEAQLQRRDGQRLQRAAAHAGGILRHRCSRQSVKLLIRPVFRLKTGSSGRLSFFCKKDDFGACGKEITPL
jgi:hypothetical protein